MGKANLILKGRLIMKKITIEGKDYELREDNVTKKMILFHLI